MSETKAAGLVLVLPPNVYAQGVSVGPKKTEQIKVKNRQYTFAPASEVRKLANGAFLYIATGKFAPTKNGRPLSIGFKKDKRGRVYNAAKRSARARQNFGLPQVQESILNPGDLEALLTVSQSFAVGSPALGGRATFTVARWADDWAGFVIYYDPEDIPSTARIGDTAPIGDLQPVIINGTQLSESPRYAEKGENAFSVFVPVRF